jgi:LPPG:FO 2-phospho-L-lactate transferase
VITVLCGGFGAARFLTGLRQATADLCCVVNTGDDLDYLGLHVAPDVDSVLYALAGCFDEERGWGVRGDTFRCNAALALYGDDWFHVGDEDLALHLKRTALLQSGRSLSEVTAILAGRWGLNARVLPMSDDPVRTVIVSEEGRLSLQEYVVARQAAPRVNAVDYEGAPQARPAPGVLDALETADVVLVAPSNPVSSIGPILALPGVREALRRRRRPTVAVAPVVRRQQPVTAAERGRARVRAALMGARGLAHTSTAVACSYRGLIDGFVLDRRDASERDEIASFGMAVLLADTLATGAGRAELAAQLLQFATTLDSPRSGGTE